MKLTTPPLKLLFCSFAFLALISACSDSSVTSQPGQPDADITPAAEDDSQEPDSIQLDWESSSHSDTFVVSEDGVNSACARCHAPIVWVPTVEDMPESCSSCKFEVEQPPPYLAQEEWRPIECHVCHQADGDEIEPEIAWLEIAQIEEYEEVAGSTELCQKCHLAGEITGHASVTVEGDHEGYQCTQCHEVHSTAASCGGEGCHDQMAEPITGHDEAHAAVNCVACHDSTGMEVGPDPATSAWTTFITAMKENEMRAFSSHSTQLSVDCERCHYSQNPWGLSEIKTSNNP